MRTHAVWLIIIYAAMLVAMAIDFVCGVMKARKAHLATNSKGYKMTCEKMAKYYFPMLCMTCVDMIVSGIVPLPLFTLAIAAFNIVCEFISIMEKTHEKAEMRKAEKTMNIILENKDELAKSMAEILKEMMKDGKGEDKVGAVD